MSKVKGGPNPSTTRLHPLKANSLASPTDITDRLYPLILAPMCAAVVFSEAEFGSLDTIIQIPAGWTRQVTAHNNGKLRFRPSIIIYRHKLALLPGDLENRMTAAILATCNYAREMTTKQAEATWRACFSSITALLSTLENEQGICREAIALSEGTGSSPPPLPRLHLVSILRYACIHFSNNYIHPVNIIQGSRLFKIPEDLSRQLGVIFEHIADTQAIQPMSLLVAAAFGRDTCRAGVECFDAEHLFDDCYRPLLDRLKRLPEWHDFTAGVQREFICLMRNARQQGQTDALSRTLAKAQKSLSDTVSGPLLDRLCREDVCLTCLAHRPHITLVCQHRLCDQCAQQDEDTESCRLCPAQHSAAIRTKPSAAGIRVLRLAGAAADAPAIGRLLRALRVQVRCPLWENFDLVIGNGVGLFFAIMIFCKGASIEECIYHVPQIKYVKQSRHGYKFGRKLHFRHDEFRSNLVRTSTSTDDSAKAQAQLEWPGCKIDAIIEYCGGDFEEAQISVIAEKLQASLFYLELTEAPPSFSIPSSVEIRVRCRLPPGPDLANLIKRLRSMDAQIAYHGDEPSTQAELCTATIWDRIRRGHPFERRLHIRAQSEETVVNVEVDSLLPGSSRSKISNCPCTLGDLVHAGLQSRVTEMESVIDSIGKMENQLRQLLNKKGL
ncbi:hypothetical protein LA080_007183 [Diaporthe eres]|nr:hypothetical protein LA080_007183 [Diaporthe eres]